MKTSAATLDLSPLILIDVLDQGSWGITTTRTFPLLCVALGAGAVCKTNQIGTTRLNIKSDVAFYRYQRKAKVWYRKERA